MRKRLLGATLMILGLNSALLFSGVMNQTLALPVYSPAQQLTETHVVEVKDGDTIKVRFSDGEEQWVRYIGPDAPEAGATLSECYSSEAKQYNESLASGKTVWLERDIENKDDFGRLLRYVCLDPDRRSMVNLMLLTEGYAIPLTIPPSYKYRSLFKRTAQEAWEAGKGLWSACRVDGILAASGVEKRASGFEGKIVMVEYSVTKIATSEDIVFLNSGQDIYTHFTAVIFHDDIATDFPESEIDLSALEGRTIRVTGKLEWYEKGNYARPEIIIEAPWQIELVTQQ